MEKVELAIIKLAQCIDMLENHPKKHLPEFRSRETLIKEILKQ